MFTTLNVRVILWATLAMALVTNYITWMQDYPPALPTATTAAGGTAGPGSGGVPPLGSTVPALPATPPPPDALGTRPPTGTAPIALTGATPPATPLIAEGTNTRTTPGTIAAGSTPVAPRVHVVTDVLNVELSLDGGELTRADLLAYPEVKGQAAPVRLLNRDSVDTMFVLQSGLNSAAGAPAPTHLARFNAPALELRLGTTQSELPVPLTWTDAQGISVTKTYTFHRGQYAIDLDYQVHNASSAPWSFAPYTQLLRNNVPVATSYFHPESYAYKGPAYDDGQKYQKLKMGGDPPTLDSAVSGGWIAGMQHHFVAAIVPPAGAPWHYQISTQGNEYLLRATGTVQQVAAGASASAGRQILFVGPKLQGLLEQASPRLYLVTDYGKLSFLARPLFWLLDKVHGIFGNWGWTIMIATLLLKLMFYPLSEASMRSMARMKVLQPRIKALQESYKDQRDKLGKAMMELYQKEKVNPVAGCLPMLIQLPVFLAFYWVLLESVEMRQAPFAGWITDLSAKDPLFILPLLMAIANYINFKLNPQMGDPTQQKMFMIMQLAMPVMFAFMPSGLVLYWTTNTVLSILQQWNINRRLVAKAAARN